MIVSIGHLPMNPLLTGQAEFKQHIVYSQNGQTFTLILLWAHRDRRSPIDPTPLIVFVQGSGWDWKNGSMPDGTEKGLSRFRQPFLMRQRLKTISRCVIIKQNKEADVLA